MKTESISRRDFVEKFMQRGIPYAQACAVYEAFCEVFEDAIVNGNKINIGNVCSIAPKRLPPREVHMGCKVTKGGNVVKSKHIYLLDSRIRYKVNLFKKFKDTHELRWK